MIYKNNSQYSDLINTGNIWIAIAIVLVFAVILTLLIPYIFPKEVK